MRITIKIHLLLLVTIVLLSNYSMQGQGRLDRANKAYNELRYGKAQELYLSAIERGDDIAANSTVYRNLGNTYYFNAQYTEAVKWYNSYFGDRIDGPTIELLRYAQSLQAAGDHVKAKRYFTAYVEKGSTTTNGFSFDDFETLQGLNANRYDLQILDSLHDNDEISFGHSVHDGKLIYATTEEKPNSFINRRDPWNNLSYLSLYEVSINEKNEVIGEPQKLRQLTKRFHEASPVITKDGNTIYFTRSNFSSEKNSNENVYLKIYRIQKKGDKWDKPEDLPINGDNFSTAHPALSHDETKLYFASNRKEGYGENDLYVTEIDRDGRLGEPKNLGNKINTGGRETFPFVSEDNYLYFSSDGHFGLGGLDVFAVKIKEDGTYGKVVNVGEPVNSYADDFSYGIDSETKYGFVSSDRTVSGDTLVHTNIYSFEETRPLIETVKILLEGHVTEVDSKDAIPNATVAVSSPEKGDEFNDILTDEEGYYSVPVNRNTHYKITAEKDGYKDKDEKNVEMKDEDEQVDLELEIDLTPGVDLAKALDILEIYFDFDKWDIRQDAERDIKKVLDILEKYPQVKINIRSHTDSRGSKEYNDILSDRRAKATKDWLIDHGIDADRLSSEGIGERELTNECKDGVPCTNEQHQANRRSEFIIVE